MNVNIGIANLIKPSGGNINVQQQQQQQQQQKQQLVAVSPVQIYEDGRLAYSCEMYYLFVLLNIVLPGIGSIVAGILYGKTSRLGDRTGNIICHGITQLIFAISIFGRVWAIRDALNYFAHGSCPACACFD